MKKRTLSHVIGKTINWNKTTFLKGNLAAPSSTMYISFDPTSLLLACCGNEPTTSVQGLTRRFPIALSENKGNIHYREALIKYKTYYKNYEAESQ